MTFPKTKLVLSLSTVIIGMERDTKHYYERFVYYYFPLFSDQNKLRQV